MVGQIDFYVFCCCVVRMDGFVQSWGVGLGRRQQAYFFDPLRLSIATVSTCLAWAVGT